MGGRPPSLAQEALMFTGSLFPYQHEAVDRILSDRRILVAYSMGTGKTVLTLAALEELAGRGDMRRCVIMVPSSLKWQWAQAVAEFTDVPTRVVTLRGMDLTVPREEVCTVITGTPAQRRRQWQQAQHADYVVMSYGAVLHDWKELCALPADALVLDEATAIKNFSAQTSKRVKKLLPPIRIALTGTPVENRPEEVFSIMEWVNARVLGRWDLFDKSYIVRNHFGGVQTYKNLGLLNRNLNRSMIRKSRLDPEVAKHLPAVMETTRHVQLDATTRAVYKAILADVQAAMDELAEAGGSDFDLAAYYAGAKTGGTHPAQGKLMACLQAARMLLDHPQLLMDSAVAFHEGSGGSRYAADFVASRYDLPDMHHSPKLNALDELVGLMLAEPGAKAAIFTDYRKMLPYLSGRLEAHGELVLFHGQLSAEEKAGALARFKTDPDVRLFISTNAGGYGLDLPQAQYLVNYDLPYSNGVLAQRNTRHVRASSTFERVHVTSLVVEDTIEERVQATLRLRQTLADAIVDGLGAGDPLDMATQSLAEHIENVD
ncbi:DEAD/DEAH box helicase [Streptomyces sp. NPDC051840]|uniref:DEAD/DEAH box helicase n=1 Tax=Streptomyces sp. NPDC051840 TaxID=3154752 RepID=UPI00341CE5CF